MYIIGTAGHVDHGKTALVRALTGINTDRLPEEQRRALTIELGFASFTDENGALIGVVDVPGHERFIRNMAGGTWALDCALLIVAADDGWMHQSEDHLRILRGMGVPYLILVITKCDSRTEERIAHVIAESLDHIQAIYGYKPPAVRTSAKDHSGIDELKHVVCTVLENVKKPDLPPMLYIDRAFVLDGIGPVVTGSLLGGSVGIGDEIIVLPTQKRAKVRSLQSHYAASTRVFPGTRSAVGLQGISRENLERGQCITTEPNRFSTGKRAILVLQAPAEDEFLVLRNHSTVEIAYGTAHNTGTLHYISPFDAEGKKTFALARIECSDSPVWYIGQHVICMQPGGSTVVAYARVLITETIDRSNLKRLGKICYESGSVPKDLFKQDFLRLYLTGYGKLTGREEQKIALFGDTYQFHSPLYIREDIVLSATRHILDQANRPQGIFLETVRNEGKAAPPEVMDCIIQHMIRSGDMVNNEGVLRGKAPTEESLTPAAISLYERIVHTGYEGFPVKQIQSSEKTLVGGLLRTKKIVMIEETFLYPSTTYKKIIQLVCKGRSIGDTFSIADAKEHLPLSRKYMLPILNAMEADGLLERIGNLRKVVKTS